MPGDKCQILVLHFGRILFSGIQPHEPGAMEVTLPDPAKRAHEPEAVKAVANPTKRARAKEKVAVFQRVMRCLEKSGHGLSP